MGPIRFILLTLLLCSSQCLGQEAPPDVTQVDVKTRNETHIELEWTKVNNILHTYRLILDGKETPIPGSDGDKVTHTVSSLSAGTKYSFTLVTVFEEVRSTGFEFTAVTAPRAVTEVIVKTRSETEIELEWTKVNILHTYILILDGTETPITESAGNTVTHTVSSLTAETKYLFTLVTVLEEVRSTGFEFAAVTAPPDVTQVNVKTRSETEIELEWTKVNILHTYILILDGTETPITESAGNTVTHTVSSLTAETKYSFTLVTVLEEVRSTGFEFAAVTAPPDVTKVDVKTRSETDIELEWTKVNILHTYILILDGKETTIPESDENIVTHTVSSLSAGTKYSFTLVTVLEEVRSTGFEFAAVTAPPDVTQVDVKTRNETHIELEWTKVNNILHTYILILDGKETPIPGSDGDKVTHTVSSLSAGTKYSFTLVTVFEEVRSTGFEFAAVTAPPDVTKVDVKTRSETDIELEWTKVNILHTYILILDGKETTIPESDENIVTHTVSSLSAGTKYSFTLFTVFEDVRSTGFVFSAVTAACSQDSCPLNSICEERAGNTFTCVCPGGLIYKDKSCKKAKVFPGELALTKPYDPKMDDKTSELFNTTSEEIVIALKEAFKGPPDTGYVSSVVLSLRLATGTAKVLYRTIRVTADVEHIFNVDSKVTADAVKAAIEKAVTDATEGEILSGATFTETNLCLKELKQCDEPTTTCKPTVGGIQCTCREGLGRTDTKNETHCQVCPSGKEADAGDCKACPIGYTGYNCNDNHQLILIVVSCVLSLLLVISMSVTTFSFFRKTKGKKSKKTDAGFTYQNPAMQAKNQFPTNQLPTIPRVDTNQHRGGSGMEMTSGGGYSRPNPNMDRGMSGYRGNTPMENNGGGIGGVRSQTGQGFDRGANMSGYRANTPTNVGMGGYRAQGNQNLSNEWGSPSQRNPPYEEPKSFNGSNFGMPRANQIVQPQDNPYNPYADRRGRF